MLDLAVVEQAKGAHMLRYGVGSYDALAVLGRWSQAGGYWIQEIARAITHDICQGHRGTPPARSGLVRSLEQGLRDDPSGADPAEAVTLHG